MSVLRKLTYPELEKLVSWAREEGLFRRRVIDGSASVNWVAVQ